MSEATLFTKLFNQGKWEKLALFTGVLFN